MIIDESYFYDSINYHKYYNNIFNLKMIIKKLFSKHFLIEITMVHTWLIIES